MAQETVSEIVRTTITEAHASLLNAGIAPNEIGEVMLSAIISIARSDPEYWQKQLYGAGLIIAQMGDKKGTN